MIKLLYKMVSAVLIGILLSILICANDIDVIFIGNVQVHASESENLDVALS